MGNFMALLTDLLNLFYHSLPATSKESATALWKQTDIENQRLVFFATRQSMLLFLHFFKVLELN
jgi:hypothetical protein